MMNRVQGLAALVLSLVSVCLSPALLAVEWQIDPYAKATGRFDDNIQFTTDDPKDSFVGVFEVGADLRNESEIVKTMVSPRIRYSGYTSDGDLNNDEELLTFSTRSNGERSTPSLEINLARDSALSQRNDINDSLINSALANTALVNKQRIRWAVRPAWSYRLTERDKIDLSLRVESVSFDDTEGTNLFDYVNQTAEFAYVRSISETKDIITHVYQKQYESDQRDSKADTVGAELGISNLFTERTKGSVFLGGQTTDSSQAQSKETNSGVTVRGIINHDTEVNKASVELSREIVPSAVGDVRSQDSFRLRFDSRVNIKLSWAVDCLFQQSEAVNKKTLNTDITTAENTNYYYFEPSLSWSLTQSWKLTGSYRVSLREFDTTRWSADRNELSLSIEYRRPLREELELLSEDIEK
jgi:hypothetical protein